MFAMGALCPYNIEAIGAPDAPRKGEMMRKRIQGGFRSLRASLTLIVISCWLLPTIILGGFMGARLSASLREKTEAAVVSSAQQARVLLVNHIEQAVLLAKAATYDDELSAAYADYRGGASRYQEYFTSVRSYLDRKYSRERLFDFALFFTPEKPGEINYTSQDYMSAALFLQNDQRAVLELCETLDTRCVFWQGAEHAYLIRNLYDTRLNRFAVLALGINPDALFEPAPAEAENGTSYYVALGGVARGLYAPSDVRGVIEEKGEKLLYTQMIEEYDYSLLLQAQIDKSVAYAEEARLSRFLILMIFLTVPLCVAVLLFARRRVVRPIGELSAASRRIEKGEMGFAVQVHGAEELEQLGAAFSSMSVRLKRLIDTSYKEQIALRDARIQAMQSRINPHFINNALEDINWQARMDGNETVSRMVETLSVLLNAGIDRSDRHLVPLSEELRIADAYFYFIGLRFGDNLRVDKHTDASLAAALVPRLVIQVLVENAVEHGVSLSGGGHIALDVDRRGDQLVIEVRNDGARLTPGDIARMEDIMAEDGVTEGHIGIRNVNQRLRLLFPGRAGLSFRRDENGDTVASVRLPYTETVPVD